VGSTKSLVFVITPLIFLVSAAVCSKLSVPLVLAAGPAYCFEHDCPERFCDNNPAKGTATCCWRDPGIIPAQNTCQTCHVNTNTGEFENCTSVLSKGKPDTSTVAPPPSGAAPPPSTNTCPENTVLDANGNCAPLTQGPTDQGTTLPPINDKADTKHHKGSNLGQGQIGGSLENGDNNPSPSTSTGDNNDKPSKDHKG
jgi:hypothetical protein